MAVVSGVRAGANGWSWHRGSSGKGILAQTPSQSGRTVISSR